MIAIAVVAVAMCVFRGRQLTILQFAVLGVFSIPVFLEFVVFWAYFLHSHRRARPRSRGGGPPMAGSGRKG
jgi:hypothetical protein